MKKFLVLMLSLLMVLALVGCGSKPQPEPEPTPEPGTDEPEEPTFDPNAVSLDNLKLANLNEYTYADSSEIANMDYVTTALATDHEINVNFVDGLVETDRFGAYVPSLSTGWEPNADATEWTFHVREGVKWVTNTGEEYADVTAEDFVTGLRHAAESMVKLHL